MNDLHFGRFSLLFSYQVVSSEPGGVEQHRAERSAQYNAHHLSRELWFHINTQNVSDKTD